MWLIIAITVMVVFSAAMLTPLHMRTVRRDELSAKSYRERFDKIDEVLSQVIRAFELLALVTVFDAAALLTRSSGIIVLAIAANIVVMLYWIIHIARFQMLHPYRERRKVFLVNLGAVFVLAILILMMKATFAISVSTAPPETPATVAKQSQ